MGYTRIWRALPRGDREEERGYLRRGHGHLLHLPHGEAVQVDPIKPKLKAPGTKRLKLKYDRQLSSFGFKFNFRRYILLASHGVSLQFASEQATFVLVWRCRLTVSKPVLKPPTSIGQNPFTGNSDCKRKFEG
jgi:hypothetical protein